MPDLLLELYSEEIPARMQAKAADDLRRLVTDRLVEVGLVYEGAKAFATPRRLALTVHGVPAKQPDVKDERKGPRVGAPDQAIEGFLKGAGLASIDQARVQQDKKGDFYIAVIDKPGRAAIDVIAEIVRDVIWNFPWPKAMHWGEPHVSQLVTERGDRIITEAGDQVIVTRWLRWIRPLHSIVATFGPETEEPEIVPFDIDGITAGNITYGHRFLAPNAIVVRRFDDYMHKLEAAKVVLDPWRREQMILADAKDLAFAQGFELVEDAGLLSEVAGLVEWPVVLMGSFDEAFLSIPPEVIRTTIRNNQKCFVLRQPDGRLAPRFILVANTEAEDGGASIISGNERVIRARLADAKFFYETDLKTRLEDRLPKFEHIVFHDKLGTQSERIARIERLAAELAPIVGADVEKAKRAARLCKADLLTEVVGEFPELQGLMGRYYALAQGEDPSVAAACEEHYKPVGPNDRVPCEPVSIAVALADKIDTLVGFWAIVEEPTGSKDPYALRRSALGVIRLVQSGFRLPLVRFFSYALEPIVIYKSAIEPAGNAVRFAATIGGSEPASRVKAISRPITEEKIAPIRKEFSEEFADRVSKRLLIFFADRLKVQLREQGARHDLVDAVFALEDQDDLLMIVRRVEALGKFLDTDDGKNLLAGTKRATNIIRIEEKKDKRKYVGAPDPSLYQQDEERALASAIDAAKKEAAAAVAREDFEGAMAAIAPLRPRVDAFFDKVTVNVDDAALRENRLKLLNEIREATRAVADFSRIEG